MLFYRLKNCHYHIFLVEETSVGEIETSTSPGIVTSTSSVIATESSTDQPTDEGKKSH